MGIIHRVSFEVGGEGNKDFSLLIEPDDTRDMLNDPDLFEGSLNAAMDILIDTRRTIKKASRHWLKEDTDDLQQLLNLKFKEWNSRKKLKRLRS